MCNQYEKGIEDGEKKERDKIEDHFDISDWSHDEKTKIFPEVALQSNRFYCILNLIFFFFSFPS